MIQRLGEVPGEFPTVGTVMTSIIFATAEAAAAGVPTQDRSQGSSK